ncbi:MAG: NACHT domain-containing protein, partial [Candidatus Humimicrobiaceae bacterium]
MIKDIFEEEYYYPQVEKIFNESININDESKIYLIVGQPGSGKSVFMQQLYEGLKNKITNLIVVRAEYLEKTYLPDDIYEAFKNFALNEPKILLLYYIDILSYSRRQELQKWLYVIDKLKDLKKITIICTCRTFEAEHLYPLNNQKWSEKFQIDVLPNEFVEKIFKKLNIDFSKLTEKIYNFLKVPLHLRLFSEIARRDKKDNVFSISTLHGLYTRLFEILDLSIDGQDFLIQLADLMLKKRTTTINYSTISTQLIEYFKKLERSGAPGILQIDGKKGLISFIHQTMIDFFSAQRLLRENTSLVEFILENNQNLFIRPVLRHIINFLRVESKNKLFKELELIFIKDYIEEKLGFSKNKEKIRFHIKTAIVSDMASWDSPTEDEGRFVIRLFNEAADKEKILQHFFDNLKEPLWYFVLKDSFIKPILTNKNDEELDYRIITSFLLKISKSYPLEIIKISKLILNNKSNEFTNKWFFFELIKNISEINLIESEKEKYLEFILSIIKKDCILESYKIKKLCLILIKISPEDALEVFFDSVIRELKTEKNESKNNYNHTDYFLEILTPLFDIIPFKVVFESTGFFEEIISDEFSSLDNSLPDWPFELLYSDHKERYGIFNLYDWYKNKVLELCENLNNNTIKIICLLQESKWETQRQLSLLAKLKNVSYFRNGILDYILNLLKIEIKPNDSHTKSEIFLRTIKIIFEHLTTKERKEIIKKILSLELDNKIDIRLWIWEPLNNIPIDYQNSHLKAELGRIRKKYNFENNYRYIPPISSSGVQWAQSPFSKDYLQSLKLRDLYNLLILNKDIKESWDFDKDKFFGGITELAREIANVFYEDLEKYKNLITKISKDSGNDNYIYWFFSKISEKNLNDEDIIWIIKLILKLYKREFLQKEIIRFLRKQFSKLTDKQILLLEEIFIYFNIAKDPEEDKFFECRSRGYSNSALSEGINSTRGALAQLIILLLTKYEFDYLKDIIKKLSNDKTISVRAVIINYLPGALRTLGWDACFNLFLNSFSKGTDEYTKMTSNFLQYVPREKINMIYPIINILYEKRNMLLGNDYAIISTLFYLREIFSEGQLLEIISDNLLIKEGREKILGILVNHIKDEN